jgi:hypothetical protein
VLDVSQEGALDVLGQIAGSFDYWPTAVQT